MIKGAIFDLDGTLLDSMFIWENIGEEYLKSMGIEPKENLRETFKTFTLTQSAEYFRENYGVTLSVSEIINDIYNMVSRIYKTKVTLKPGVSEFLNRLHKNGVKMCIATLTDKSVAEAVLRRLNVSDYFCGIFCADDVGSGKETPELYLHALKHLGTKISETVVFEDVLHAVLTAKNAGFKTASVFDRYEPRQKELLDISDYYISDFESFCFTSKMKTALTIAGSDSGGGAGIQADIKTMTMNGVFATSAVTSLTAQNTLGVRSVYDSSPDFLKEQIDAVFEDIFPDSVKIGMVSSSELIEVIAERLSYYKAKNIVVDPVMVATSGSSLINPDAVKTLTTKLFPLAMVVTPNIPEAEIITNMKITNEADMQKASKQIGDSYGCSVLLKGGHNTNDANDLLYENGNFTWFSSKRINNPNTHGTGCTLSSAIASNLAKGHSLADSVKYAKEYVSNALIQGLDLGKGSGPLKHNFMVGNDA